MSPLQIPIYVGASGADMGRQAANDVASELRCRLATQDRVRMIFAAAPSQSPMLEALIPEQVSDGCFAALEEVPRRALTLTIPRLLAAQRIYCCVPGRQKRKAITRMLEGPIGVDCPATALRRHPRCVLYLDTEAAPDGITTNREYRDAMKM